MKKDDGVYVLISQSEISILKNIYEHKKINDLEQNLSKHKQNKIKKVCYRLNTMGLIKLSKSGYYVTDDGKRALKNFKPFPSGRNQHKVPFLLKIAGLIFIILLIMGLVSLTIVRNA